MRFVTELSILVLLGTLNPLTAVANEPENCKQVDTARYTGLACDKKPEGQGILRREDGSVEAEGTFKNGNQHGLGTYTYPDGTKYSGNFVDGLFSGQGKLIKPTGKIYYEGAFENDKFHGQGIFTQDNGFVYEGDHKDGLVHGKGIEIFNGEIIYEGEFADGHREGNGTLNYAPSENDFQERFGVAPDGYNPDLINVRVVKYIGEFKRHFPNGSGKLYYSNGDTYEGRVENGLAMENNKHFQADGRPSNKHAVFRTFKPPKIPAGVAKSGHCVISYDIGARGVMTNIEFVSCSDNQFMRAALASAGKWRYYSKIVDGKKTDRPNWIKRITFRVMDYDGKVLPE